MFADGCANLSTFVKGPTHVDISDDNRKSAFTLAEVLITLGIIGIVAAMTLPTLIGNYQKKELITKLKKTYTVFSQAFLRSQLDNGPFDTWPAGAEIGDMNIYFETYYKPYFNGIQFCPTAKKCGYENNYPWKDLKGNSLGWNVLSLQSRVSYKLNDGTFVFQPLRTTDSNGNPAYVSYMYVDINGFKKPNVVGKDVFIFQIDKTKGLVPYCYNKSQAVINASCTKNTGGNTNCCTAKIMADGWEIKSDYPW